MDPFGEMNGWREEQDREGEMDEWKGEMDGYRGIDGWKGRDRWKARDEQMHICMEIIDVQTDRQIDG